VRKREIMEEEQDATVKRLTPSHSPSEIRGNAEKFGKEKL